MKARGRMNGIRAAALALALTALVGASGAAIAQQRGGTLVMPMSQAPRHLNSAVQSGIATMGPAAQLFASPLRYDDKWNPQPYLAQKWELAPDGKSLTLHLVKNAVFHDGKPVTSEDVAFSIMTIKANHPFSSMLAPVEKVETPDAYTAIIRMSKPHPAILIAMSPALCPIIPKHIYGDGKDIKTHPNNTANVIGSGPFKLAEFKPGQHVVMERFDRFFIPGRPYLDKIIMKVNPDETAVVVGAERGEFNLLSFITNARNIERLRKAGWTATDKGYEGIGPLTWVAFNLKRKPMSDVRVRQAISYAMDRDFITKSLHGGLSKPAFGPIVPSSPFYDASINPYRVDLKKAEALLDAAGYKKAANGERFAVTMDYIPGDDYQSKNLAEYLKGQLRKVGIKLEVRASPDFPSWAKRVASFDFDMTTDIVFNWGDPVIGVHRTYLASNIRNIIWTNTQSYDNPKVDELLNNAAEQLDPVKRRAYYAVFQKIVNEDLPVAWVNVGPYHTVYDKRWRNLPVSIWGAISPLDELWWAAK
jgi:peptide/nickel transport system substrate-binding protein